MPYMCDLRELAKLHNTLVSAINIGWLLIISLYVRFVWRERGKYYQSIIILVWAWDVQIDLLVSDALYNGILILIMGWKHNTKETN